ncbi:MAG: uroporphyrinogen decarboxylase [Candidatus Micrarchaeota archaeon]|nr:uroporphyrinogen decarboxylase [Candidatus Micrarchaeota archaeon]MDE1864405.1 uroporphyrinogen decarboxylase [Candidatus Micrarchaeota archaeon]
MIRNDILLKACRQEPTEHTPIWIMRQAGRYLPEYREIRKEKSLMEIFNDPDLASEIVCMPVERFGFDAAILFADIMLPLKSIGMDFEIRDEVGPVIKDPVRSPQSVEKLSCHEVRGDVPFVFELIRKAKRRLDVPLIGFSGAPFTLASYLIEGKASKDFVATKAFMRRYPQAWHTLMRKLTELTVSYLAEQISEGVDVIQLFDSWVGILGRDEYDEFVLRYSQMILGSVKKKGIPSIHFGTNTSHLLESMKEAGGDVIGIDWRINIDEAWKRLGNNIGIQGNLDPKALLSSQSLKAMSLDVLKKANRIGHIFNLGHGILPNTPVENVAELVNVVHSYKRQYDG